MNTDPDLPLSPDQIKAYMKEVNAWKPMEIMGFDFVETRDRYALMSWQVPDRALRLGGTIAGPAYFAAADSALFLALIATLGFKGMSVTTNMNMNFLKASTQRELSIQSDLLHVGRTSVAGEVRIFETDSKTLLTHATGTFRLPSN